MRFYFMLFTIILVFSACGGNSLMVFYDGERRAPTEVATLEIGNVYLMSIDTLERRYQAISKKYIEVLPGRHTISVNYRTWKGRSTKPIDIEFTAESGHKYIVKAKAGYRRWTSWIIDLTLDSLVAGSAKL